MNRIDAFIHTITIVICIASCSLSTQHKMEKLTKKLEEKIVFLEAQVEEANQSIDILGYNEKYLLDTNRS